MLRRHGLEFSGPKQKLPPRPIAIGVIGKLPALAGAVAQEVVRHETPPVCS